MGYNRPEDDRVDVSGCADGRFTSVATIAVSIVFTRAIGVAGPRNRPVWSTALPENNRKRSPCLYATTRRPFTISSYTHLPRRNGRRTSIGAIGTLGTDTTTPQVVALERTA